ncbi:Bgt-50739 [Blumeria graminis f. sp. tritici]|uniref:Bgt-50739 n=1 Tax=Blumeria graminis f. sp. tritici TaxID=62690 RepID=A0A9X9LAJ9_BLUGR|nr:Bgt-50739 [Blumeria graminis f. sp. tritici]
MVSMRPWLSMMQDNPPSHAAAIKMEGMSLRPFSRFSGWPTRLIFTRLKLFGIG